MDEPRAEKEIEREVENLLNTAENYLSRAKANETKDTQNSRPYLHLSIQRQQSRRAEN